RRTAFVDIGGFPEVPLMEDVEFFRRLYLRGRIMCNHKRISVSPRRYEAIGRMRLTFAYGLIATLYTFGVPLSMLASIYKRMCCLNEGRLPGSESFRAAQPVLPWFAGLALRPTSFSGARWARR